MDYGLLYYLITVVDTLRGAFSFVLPTMIVLTICAIVLSISFWAEGWIDKKTLLVYWKKGLKYVIPLVVVSVMALTFIPEKKDLLVITGLALGSGAITETSKGLGEVAPTLVKLINKEVKDLLDEGGKDE